MQNLQWQRDAGSAHLYPPLYIVALCHYHINEEVFEKDLRLLVYPQYRSVELQRNFKTNQVNTPT